MARSNAPIEINKFTGGLFTDSSPLTSPDGYSLDEENMVLNIDGSRKRRLGLDFEEDFTYITTTMTSLSSFSQSYKWKNAGGDPTKTLLVVQCGNQLKFFDLANDPISSSVMFTQNFGAAAVNSVFDFTTVDGVLIVTSGQKNPITFTYTAPSTITVGSLTLYIRDLFGVADSISGSDLLVGSGLSIRPALDVDTHIYNLRNQSWGIPRIDGDGSPPPLTPSPSDPITAFQSYSSATFPSNSDVVSVALYPNPENTDNRTITRFFAQDLVSNPLGAARAPAGYFIIDAMERGASRIGNEASNRALYPSLTFVGSGLPTDSTPGGPSVVAEFAGRVWYAGFSGEVTGGDSQSPRMSSYILFSQIVNTLTDAASCYQSGDPTSSENPDIIDTDGGFIRMNGAYGIKRMINLGDALMIIAQNGVWRIVGGTDKGFTATNYIVEKISERGCSNTGSIVLVDNSVMYWGDDAIYHLKMDQFGSWQAQSISFGRIQNYFDSLTLGQKRKVIGAYDSFERKVKWLYSNSLNNTGETTEIVLDTILQAFSLMKIKMLTGLSIPRPIAMYVGNPYDNNKKEVGYIVAVRTSPVVQYTFAAYRNTAFRDWYSFDNVGVDAAAYTVAGYIAGGDFQHKKQVKYITTYMAKTETGYVASGTDFAAVNPSSCLIQTQWEWTDNENAGKWSPEFQAYRHRRLYMPTAVTDTYDDGYSVVVTKNKVRGKGRVLAIKFSTEADKDFHLYGWSLIMSVQNDV